jgi:diguanylate cyclase (GGDEF)-like protein
LGARLAGQVRAQDFVCRWGGDEFVAILECALSHAIARSHQIAQHLAGPYRVMVEGKELRVDLSVSVGVAQHNAGETAEQLFQRVDGSMYHQKNAEAAG